MNNDARTRLRVFLCHASQDKLIVRELYNRLKAEGWIDPWLDEENLYPGQDWNFEIEKAVEATHSVIVFLSSNSVTKEGYVQRELRFVLQIADSKPEGAIFVIPVRLDNCSIPRRLALWQYMDYFPESNKKSAYVRLLKSLRVRAKKNIPGFEDAIAQARHVKHEKENTADVKISKKRSGKRIQRTEKDNTFIEGNTIISLKPNYLKLEDKISYKNINFSIPAPPSLLVGREKMIANVVSDLISGEQVSVVGLAGIGKTSLAAFVSKDLAEKEYIVFWVKAGRLSIDELCNEVSRSLNDQTTITMDLEQKLHHIQNLLHLYEVKVVILDDVWDVVAARRFTRDAIPAGCTVLATGRRRIGIGKPYDIDPLNENDSENLFRYHSKISKGSVRQICKLLNGHPMGLEIAGKLCWINGLSVKEFENSLEKAGNIIKPLALSNDAHENMWATLRTSYEFLTEKERNLFEVFGMLWSVTATSEILTSITGMTEAETTKQLNGLVANSLIRPELTADGLRIYRLHDLSFVFAQAVAKQEKDEVSRQNTLLAFKTYAEKYAVRDREAHNYLEAERENLLNSAQWAYEHAKWSYVNNLALWLYDKSEFLRWRGYNTEATKLLDLGLDAARKLNYLDDVGRHLTNMGIAYRQLGQIEKGISYHQQSLEVMRSIGNKQGESDSLGEIGWAYNRLGRMNDAIAYLNSAYSIAREIGNKRWEAIWLGTLGRVYTDIGQIERGIQCHIQAYEIMLAINDKRGQGARLGELGWDYLALEQPERAIQYFQDALSIAKEIGDRRREGAWLGGIGDAYLLLREGTKSLKYLMEGLQIARSIGDRGNEADVLNCLARFQLLVNEHEKAESALQQSLKIYRELKHQRGIGDCFHVLGDILVAQAKIAKIESLKVNLLNSAKQAYLDSLEIRKKLNDPRASNSLSSISDLPNRSE